MENAILNDWNKVQKDIWANVIEYTKLILEGEWEEVLEFFHDGYSGWNNYGLIPASKIDIINELQHLERKEVDSYTLTPVTINIFKGVAVVHYLFAIVYKTAKGKLKTKRTRKY
jgi:hypothetical protein